MLLQVVGHVLLASDAFRQVDVVARATDQQKQNYCANSTVYDERIRCRITSTRINKDEQLYANLQQDPENLVGVHVVVVMLVPDLLDDGILGGVVAGGELGDDSYVRCATGERQANSQMQQPRLEYTAGF